MEKYIKSDVLSYHILNYIIQKNKFSSYLEIGVYNGDTIKKIEILHKDGVDPGHEGRMSEFVNYRMTSDEFFNSIKEEKKYDIIFIDGLHHCDQVDRDIQNSIRHLNCGGYILLHDCNPPEKELQLVPRQTSYWNGDVWKSIVKLRCSAENLEISVVDTDWGVGVIKTGNQDIYKKDNINDCLKWEYFHENRKELLNIISLDQFYLKY